MSNVTRGSTSALLCAPPPGACPHARLPTSLLTIDDCILEELCVNNEIDADDFDVSLLTIDDDIFEYHERNVQRKKCARKSESRRSRPKLRERVASRCRGRQVRPGTCHRTRW